MNSSILEDVVNLTDYEKLLNHMDSLTEPISGAEAKKIIKSYLAGKRVFCCRDDQRHYGLLRATQLLKQNKRKAEIVSIISQTLGYSRQWATTLASRAIELRYLEITRNAGRCLDNAQVS